MLKTLVKDDTTLTPYIATKDWTLSNIDNEDVVLSEAGNTVVVENVDFEFTGALPNYNCNVAKEDQENDLATVRDGLKTTGLFYPQLDPTNIDGTYKRMVYAQIKTMFYNNYRDPTQMWGLEKIDFDSSETKKFLSDLIKVFYIPTAIMGEKIVPGSVTVIDNTLDDAYVITDDSQNNLFAGTNLFSKQQELRKFTNIFTTGSDGSCNAYFNFSVATPTLTGSLFAVTNNFGTASLSWSISDPSVTGFLLQRSVDNITFSPLTTFGPDTQSTYDYPLSGSTTYYYEVSAFNIWGTGSNSNVVSVFVQVCGLTNTAGQSYTLGPFDTFECYTTGSSFTGSNFGLGWSAPWVMRVAAPPDFTTVNVIDIVDYIATSGSSIIGLNSGSGWASTWTGSQ